LIAVKTPESMKIFAQKIFFEKLLQMGYL